MRRLATQTRNDGYASAQDYQQLHKKISQRFITKTGTNRISFYKDIELPAGGSNFIGFGGFVLASTSGMLTIQLIAGSHIEKKSFDIGANWSRIGLAIPARDIVSTRMVIKLEFDNITQLNIWGFETDFLTLPEGLSNQEITSEVLSATHICPETLYLQHDNALNLDIDTETSSLFEIQDGSEIYLKKCSFCQRHLPLNPTILGSLSFHKHNAKISKHQNECRSCKKWRINNTFNPLRTSDQLHESSVITRERKLLLREPSILQEIKERTGAGLRSQVWERFNRKCFCCGINVRLDEFQLDHTRPLSYLWPIDLFATCLCPEHNNQKKDKFPIDFYTTDQLIRLAEITGIDYHELILKDVNQVELDRVLSNIVDFAKSWDSRTFAAVARKITELRPAVDLFSILRAEDERIYNDLIIDLADRPESVIETACDNITQTHLIGVKNRSE